VSDELQGVDYATQIGRLRGMIESSGGRVRSRRLDDYRAFAQRIDLAARGAGQPSVVVGDDVGAELGRPGAGSQANSHALVLPTVKRELIDDGWVHCLGFDVADARPGQSLAFAQIVLLSHPRAADLDLFELESNQYLANRVAGYMARTLPGRLWVRFSKKLIARGFGLFELGCCLLAAYRMDFEEIEAAEVILVCGEEALTPVLDSIAAEVKVLSGRQRKLRLRESGVYECDDLDCDNCDEREVCDALKDVSIRYRKRNAN
jgi:CO dehydrogenase/acetyl-CoA synthase beta subunit